MHASVALVAICWNLPEELPESRCSLVLLLSCAVSVASEILTWDEFKAKYGRAIDRALFLCSIGGVGDFNLERARSEMRQITESKERGVAAPGGIRGKCEGH